MTTMSHPASQLAVAPSYKRRALWVRASRVLLRIPIDLKVLGANFVIIGVAGSALLTMFHVSVLRWADLAVVMLAVAVAGVVNFALVRIALSPVNDLERVAKRVSEGRFGERVPESLVADRGLAHLARTMNEMLDTVAAGRERMRKLGADVVFAQERERAFVAKELNDRVAQTLVAASFQVAAAVNELGSSVDGKKLSEARELLRTAVEEIRNVSRTLHPRVADDLGLPAALEALADSTRQRSLIDVAVDIDTDGQFIPAPIATTLYRVARAALSNVEQHSDAGSATVSLCVRPGFAELRVSDDGRGIEVKPSRHSVGSLDAMRERLSLAGGELHIDSSGDGGGTRVIARMSLGTEAA